jgi:Zn-dependent protease with chaperone function
VDIIQVLVSILPAMGIILLVAKFIYYSNTSKGASWGIYPEFDDLARAMNVKLAVKYRRWEITKVRGIAETNPVKRCILLDEKNFFKLGQEQRKAVIAHELFHLKLNHTIKSSVLFISGCCISLIIDLSGFSVQALIVFILFLLANILLRHKFEYQADNFSAKYVGAEPFIEVLKSISRYENRRNLASLLTHPSVTSRITKLKRWVK